MVTYRQRIDPAGRLLNLIQVVFEVFARQQDKIRLTRLVQVSRGWLVLVRILPGDNQADDLSVGSSNLLSDLGEYRRERNNPQLVGRSRRQDRSESAQE